MISLKMGCEKFVGSGKWVGPVVLMSDWAGYSRCLGAAQIGVIFGLIWCQKIASHYCLILSMQEIRWCSIVDKTDLGGVRLNEVVHGGFDLSTQ